MRTSIYYFSATGNTLSLARNLSSALGGADIRAVKDFREKEIVEDNSDIVVLCFPVYTFGAPRILEEFAAKLKVKDTALVYLCVSYGALLCDALKAFRNVAAKNGLSVSGGYGVHMPGNYQPMYDVLSDEKQQKLFAGQQEKIPVIAGAILRGDKGRFEKNFGILGLLLSHGVHKSFAKQVRTMDKSFRLSDSCDGCGLCAKVCPVHNISIREGKPVWNHSCEQCLACFHWCPRKAIQQGSKSHRFGRYHNPAVVLNDFIKKE